MTFKLNKTQQKQLAEVVSELEEKQAALESAIAAFNDAMNDARTFIEEFVQDAQSAFDDKSEKWQEGEAAERAQEWIGLWEGAMNDLEEEVDLTLPDWQSALEHPVDSADV